MSRRVHLFIARRAFEHQTAGIGHEDAIGVALPFHQGLRLPLQQVGFRLIKSYDVETLAGIGDIVDDVELQAGVVGVDLGELGYAVVKVSKTIPRDAPAADAAKQDRAQYAQWWTVAEGQAYYALLKDRFKVQMKVSRPAPLSADFPIAAVQ